MTAEHKAAMARGRAEGEVVRDYLEALRTKKPKRGRKRTPDSIKKRLEPIEAELQRRRPPSTSCGWCRSAATSAASSRRWAAASTSARSRTAFVKVAKAYSERQGISYAVVARRRRVEAAVLKRAGISRAA